MVYRVACIIFALTSPALAQRDNCIPTPGASDTTALRACEVLRRGDLGSGLSWEVQRRIYQAPRAGSGDMTLRMMVVRHGSEAVAWTEPSFGNPQRPESMATPRGLLLRLPVQPNREGGRPLDEVWLRREPLGGWVRLDARLWRAEAEARLSPGEALAPAFRLEIRPLRATGTIISPAQNAPGRADRGAYTAWLDIGEDRLLLIGFSRR